MKKHTEYRSSDTKSDNIKTTFVEGNTKKKHDTGRHLTNPHGFKTPIFSTLKQGSNLPGARKKINNGKI